MERAMTVFARVEDLLSDISRGRMVVIVDDEGRENEGDLICASRAVTREMISFMISEGRGLVCMSLDESGMKRLGLQRLRSRGESRYGTLFYDSIESRVGVTTGISAGDRACTIRVACDEESGEDSVIVPGHVFTLCADERGVLGRRGHTEASLDLSRMAGMGSSGVLCEVVGDDGEMLRLEGLKKFCLRHKLLLGTIESIVEYRETYGL